MHSIIVLPSEFVIERRGPVWLAAHREFLPGAHALGLLEAGGLEALFARERTVASGRGALISARLPGGGPELLFRRVLHGGAAGPMLGDRFLSFARPLGELAHTERLRAAGAPVVRAVLAVSERRAGFWRSALATVFEHGARDALAWLRAGPGEAEVLAFCAAAGRCIRRFHEAGGRHADLHLKNLLVRKREGAPDVLVIDLDRARSGALPSARERMAELMRLYRSLEKRGLQGRVGAEGVARFLDAYCMQDHELRKALLARIGPELRKLAWRRLGYRLQKIFRSPGE